MWRFYLSCNSTQSEFQAADGHGNFQFLVKEKGVKAGFHRRCCCAWVGASEKGRKQKLRNTGNLGNFIFEFF